jgi:hypothetical protein
VRSVGGHVRAGLALAAALGFVLVGVPVAEAEPGGPIDPVAQGMAVTPSPADTGSQAPVQADAGGSGAAAGATTQPSAAPPLAQPEPPAAPAGNGGQKETGEKETGQKETGQKETGQKETGQKETGEKETGQKETGQKETGQKETGEEDAGQKEGAVEEALVVGAAPGGPPEEPASAAPAAGVSEVARDEAVPAAAPQEAPARVTAPATPPVTAFDRTQPAGPRAARVAVLAAPRAAARTRAMPQRDALLPPPPAAKPLAAPSAAPALDVPRAPVARSSRPAADDAPKYPARLRADAEPAPPSSTMPPGGVGQAAGSAAGSGAAAPELPGILIVIVAATGIAALQRHRIALIVPTPTACGRPLERPG